ncbi:hypothetical protein HY797_03065 [Candidatus Falkowbacteria bacterium]|nr:hypothetical protein [Candidatus Falkowbacteria bacterium]
MKNNIFLLKNLYVILFIAIIAAIVFHPFILEKSLMTLSHEEEENLEVILTISLLGLGYLIYVLYEREARKKQSEMI